MFWQDIVYWIVSACSLCFLDWKEFRYLVSLFKNSRKLKLQNFVVFWTSKELLKDVDVIFVSTDSYKLSNRVDQMWANVRGGKVKMMFNLNFSFLLIPSCQLSVGLWGQESATNLLISEHIKYLQLQENIIRPLFWLKILFPPQIFLLSTNNKNNFGGVDVNSNIWEALDISRGKEGLLFRSIITNGPILWRGETDQNTQSTIQRKTIFNKYFT